MDKKRVQKIKIALISLTLILWENKNVLKLQNDNIDLQKGQEIEDDINKVILTLEEQYDLSLNAQEIIAKNYTIASQQDNTQTLNLSDEFIITAYENALKISKPSVHPTSYYDSKTDTFDIPSLIKQIRKNSLKNETIVNDAFLEDEIEYLLIKFLDIYLPTIEKTYQIDKNEIACNLANLAFLYSPDDLDNQAYISEKIVATEDVFQKNIKIIYCDKTENIYETDWDNSTSYHEFFHLLNKACNCQHELFNGVYYYPSGIGIATRPLDIEAYDVDLNYKFIEEAMAENSLTNFSLEPVVYEEERYIWDNILLVLALNPNFNKEVLNQASLEQKPIKFIQEFMVDSQDSQDSFCNNVRFLMTYDYLFLNKEYQNRSDLTPNNVVNKQEFLENLINYAQIELTRLFFNNLILNTDIRNTYDEQGNNYYIDLFYKRMIKSYEFLAQKNLNQAISLETYDKAFQEMYLNYLEYLQNKGLNPIFIDYFKGNPEVTLTK